MNGVTVTIGRDLARLRGGRKQSELAAKLHVDASRISRVEHGEITLTPEELRNYLEAIGTEEAAQYSGHLSRCWAIIQQPDFWHPDREVLARADRAIVRLDDFVKERMVEGPVLAQFELHKDSLLRAVRYLQSAEHGLAFIGDIGVGKSTAICTLTSLLIPDEPDDVRRRVVLETNTGGATICEVRLKYRTGTNYGILIQPQSMDEIFNAVGDLCLSLLGSNQTQASQPEDAAERPTPSERGVPAEINRALRNMAGLARSRRRLPGGKVVNVDPAAELAKQLGSQEKLRADFFERLQLAERTQTELWYDPASGKGGHRWLKDTFNAINNGRRPDVSLPKRIDVLVPTPLFEHPHDAIEVIDTKGVDGTAIRPDTEGYVDDDRTLAILCTHFKSAPDLSIQGLIEHVNTRGAGRRLAESGLLLVLTHGSEALDTKDDAGEYAPTAEDAYAIKQEQVTSKLSEIHAEDLPVLFYNAISDNPDNVRQIILAHLNCLRESRAQQILEIEAAVERLIDNYEEAQVRAADNEVRRQLVIFLNQYSQLPPRIRQSYQALIEAVRDGHPRTAWASARRNGTWANLDVYHFIGAGTAIDARLRASRALAHLNSILAQMLKDENLVLTKDLLNEIIRSSGVWQTEFLTEVTEAGREIVRAALYDDDYLWNQCEQLYGQGVGYRNAVARKIQEWCESRQDLLSVIEARVSMAWDQHVIDPLQRLAAQAPAVQSPNA